LRAGIERDWLGLWNWLALGFLGWCLGRRCEVESGIHVKDESAVGVDVRPEQRREGAAVFIRHSLGPLRFREDLLKEEGVDVDEGGLEQVQREHGDLLVFLVGAGELAALAVEEDLVGAVPGLHYLAAFVDLSAERWRGTRRRGWS
jgi:hypothetical protein